MFDRETWRFINTFAPWLSALGTLTAVVVSLRLARRAARLDVRVFPAIVNLFQERQPDGERPECVNVRIVNHGREAKITGISWWLLGFKREAWFVFPSDFPYSSTVPAKLNFGDEAHFLFPTETYSHDARALLDRINESWFPGLTVRLLRVGVFASTGEAFRAPLDKHLRAFLLERARQIKQAA